ncbi:hypothetical protein C8Q80DRAFT_1265036 [Daedaleopsis nitida]|nr:hypothetical protein C8Q80DRAFT_1265036 [Daedaleopsis nitida]
MFVPPKPVFNTSPILLRATPDCLADESELPCGSLPEQPHHDEPAPPSDIPVSVPVAGGEVGSELTSATTAPTNSVTTSTLPILATPLPETALATDIQHFGHRNFVGLLVLGLLALLGLVLWLSFGAWPRRVMRRVRARFSSGSEALVKDAGKGGWREVHAGTQCGRGCPALDLRRHIDAATARAHHHGSREPSEKAGTASSEDVSSCSPQSTELEVEGLDKESGIIQESNIPRVRFAGC